MLTSTSIIAVVLLQRVPLDTKDGGLEGLERDLFKGGRGRGREGGRASEWTENEDVLGRRVVHHAADLLLGQGGEGLVLLSVGDD